MKGFLLASTVAVLTAACGGGISVSNDWDPNHDFSGIETFAVMDQTGEGQVDNFTSQRIKSAIVNEMEGKGFRRVNDPNSADVVAGWQAATDQRSSFQTVSTGWSGYGWGSPRWGGASMGTSTTTERTYEVGTLVIGIFDVSDQELVFQSAGSGTLPSGNQSPDQRTENINEAVAKILEEFPPGSGS